jgi:hypothetical protein
MNGTSHTITCKLRIQSYLSPNRLYLMLAILIYHLSDKIVSMTLLIILA